MPWDTFWNAAYKGRTQTDHGCVNGLERQTAKFWETKTRIWRTDYLREKKKKNAKENSKNLHRYSWIFDCKAAHKLGVKYMSQSKEWLLREKKKSLRAYTRLKGIQILFSQREKPHWTPEACKRASRNTIPSE